MQPPSPQRGVVEGRECGLPAPCLARMLSSWWLLVCVVQYDSPGELRVGLEVMLFARRVFGNGSMWIPPKRAEMIGAHSHTQRHLPQETPEVIPAGAIRGPATYRWAQMANLRSHRPLGGCSHLRVAPLGEPLSEPGKTRTCRRFVDMWGAMRTDCESVYSWPAEWI